MTESEAREMRDMTGAKREMTQCPIFLLQIAQIGLTADYDVDDYKHLDDGVFVIKETGEEVSGRAFDDFLLERGEARRYWTTFDGGVWWTREDAEAYGESRSYHYGRKGKDWRVFCVCAFGELAKLLDQVSQYD